MFSSFDIYSIARNESVCWVVDGQYGSIVYGDKKLSKKDVKKADASRSAMVCLCFQTKYGNFF